jgi:hypothetical protein
MPIVTFPLPIPKSVTNSPLTALVRHSDWVCRIALAMSKPLNAVARASVDDATFAPIVAELSRLARYEAVKIVAIIKLMITSSMATPRRRVG